MEMGEDGTYTETPEDNTTTTQPPVEQTAPVQQNPAPANNGGSGSSSGTYSDGSISHNSSVTLSNGHVKTGVREFASVSDLNGVSPIKEFEIVSVGGVPYTWTGYEWADYSGFSTEVIDVDIGGLSGELVGY